MWQFRLIFQKLSDPLLFCFLSNFQATANFFRPLWREPFSIFLQQIRNLSGKNGKKLVEISSPSVLPKYTWKRKQTWLNLEKGKRQATESFFPAWVQKVYKTRFSSSHFPKIFLAALRQKGRVFQKHFYTWQRFSRTCQMFWQCAMCKRVL